MTGTFQGTKVEQLGCNPTRPCAAAMAMLPSEGGERERDKERAKEQGGGERRVGGGGRWCESNPNGVVNPRCCKSSARREREGGFGCEFGKFWELVFFFSPKRCSTDVVACGRDKSTVELDNIRSHPSDFESISPSYAPLFVPSEIARNTNKPNNFGLGWA